MLLDSLFKIQQFASTESEVTAVVEINPGHEIFNGHFPGQPVVPGVCMMQLVKELVERHLQKKLTIREADNLKFLSVIDPRVDSIINANITLTLKDNDYTVQGSLFAGSVTFFKLKAIFTPSTLTQ